MFWVPPETDERKFVMCRRQHRGWSFWDIWSFKWFKEHPQYIVADSDKSLGLALVECVEQRTNFHLAESCTEMAEFAMRLKIDMAFNEVEKLLNQAKSLDLVTTAEVRYVRKYKP
eukprot:325029-Amphidinium_carterae.1